MVEEKEDKKPEPKPDPKQKLSDQYKSEGHKEASDHVKKNYEED